MKEEVRLLIKDLQYACRQSLFDGIVRTAAADDDDDDDDTDNQQQEQPRVEVCAICVDTTCCSVVALDDTYQPLRPSLLWMDARSSTQTTEILHKCRGDPALRVNCDGHGPISAEWMTPKALWIKQNEPHTWNKATHICEYQDYINHRLTGVMCASSCNAAARWHWDGQLCVTTKTQPQTQQQQPYPGRPISLYETLGMPELADKLPTKCIPMGSLVGQLTADAARHLGLTQGLPIVQVRKHTKYMHTCIHTDIQIYKQHTTSYRSIH